MFAKILVPLDRSQLAEAALGRAGAIARTSGAAIHLVLVHDSTTLDGFADEAWTEGQWRKEEQYLKNIAKELQSGSGVAVTFDVMHAGDPIESICRRAHEGETDLIVMSSHGRTGWNRFWLGSVADGVVKRSAVPVLLLRPTDASRREDARKAIRRILVPLDGSDAGLEILPIATELARCERAAITLLRVVQPVPQVAMDMTSGYPYTYPPLVIDQDATQNVVDQSKRQLDHTAAGLAETGRIVVDTAVIVEARVGQGICDFAARGFDLIAMCTHGGGATRLVIGSIADKVIRGCDEPMLLYHPVASSAPREEHDAHGALSPV